MPISKFALMMRPKLGDCKHIQRSLQNDSTILRSGTTLSIFQHIMENIFKCLSRVCVYIEYINVSRKTVKDHSLHLKAFLTCLKQAGLRLK